jgi:S-adenosylmethionine-dependent methyltransferase
MLRTSMQYHDAHAKEYDEGYLSPYWRIYTEITWNYIQPLLPKSKKDSWILDAGGGTGFWAVRLAKLGYRVVLSDVSKGMLDEARRKIAKEKPRGAIEIVEADITDLKPFKKSQFHLTLAEGDPVSYCDNPKRAIAELARVTRRGGFVTVSVDNKLNWAARCIQRGDFKGADKVVEQGIAIMRGENHSFPAHAFTVEELEDFFRESCLTPVRIVGKPVWTVNDESLQTPATYKRMLAFELRFSSERSVAGRGGHIAVVGKKA